MLKISIELICGLLRCKKDVHYYTGEGGERERERGKEGALERGRQGDRETGREIERGGEGERCIHIHRER
jgi:hypothetical protein